MWNFHHWPFPCQGTLLRSYLALWDLSQSARMTTSHKHTSITETSDTHTEIVKLHGLERCRILLTLATSHPMSVHSPAADSKMGQNLRKKITSSNLKSTRVYTLSRTLPPSNHIIVRFPPTNSKVAFYLSPRMIRRSSLRYSFLL